MNKTFEFNKIWYETLTFESFLIFLFDDFFIGSFISAKVLDAFFGAEIVVLDIFDVELELFVAIVVVFVVVVVISLVVVVDLDVVDVVVVFVVKLELTVDVVEVVLVAVAEIN